MNIFLEKLEKNKSPFLQDYENEISEFYENKAQKDPF